MTQHATHSDGDNARYWAEQARGWLEDNVHGKDVEDVVAISGDALVLLGDEWRESHVDAIRDGLLDGGFPHIRVEDRYRCDAGTRLRIDADDSRLPVGF